MDDYRERQYKDPCRIGRVFRGKEDHGCETVMIYVEGPGWGQGFGMLSHEDEKESADFLSSLCRVFGVADSERLVGMECVALREFPYHSESIAALQSLATGRTFSIEAWVNRYHPDPSRSTSAVDRRIARIRAEISRAHARIEQLTRDESAIRSDYRRVEGEAP